MLDTIQLHNALKNFKCFKGIFPVDEIPLIHERPAGMIVNTDKADKPGEHWIALMLLPNGRGEVFDSLASNNIDIYNYMKLACPQGFTTNNFIAQNDWSTVCGNYASFFLILRCMNISFETIINVFSQDTLSNDNLISAITEPLYFS